MKHRGRSEAQEGAVRNKEEELAAAAGRANLRLEVARQNVRLAKEELKRARKRHKEAKREAKRARKRAAAARKACKQARHQSAQRTVRRRSAAPRVSASSAAPPRR